LARTPFRKWFERREKRRGSARQGRRVILWVDTFNNYFCPQTLAAAVDVLEHAGCEVTIPERALCCGRPLYDYGMLDEGRELFRQALDELAPAVEQGIPVVGVEPSCVAAFRDELPLLMAGDERAALVSSRVLTLAEFLEEIGYEPPQLERKAYLHGHCHHKAVMKMTNEERVLHKMSIDYEVVEPGCCGMAGAFGFEREKYDVSRAIGERAFLPAMRDAGDEVLLIADGFSCREQARQGAGRTPLHLAEVIQLGLHQEVLERTGGGPEPASARLRPADLVGRPSPAILALVAWISLLLTLAGALVGLF
jgi:Fe-S oxidoreductase